MRPRSSSRSIAPALPMLLAVALASASACSHKRPAPAPTPVATATETDAERARRDSVARAAAARDSTERARVERERLDREARDRAERARLDEMRRTMETMIYFDFDREDLSADARATLDAKLTILTADQGLTIRIAGHADERGSDEYNLALGQRRAAAAKRYLVQRGIAADRIATASFGEERGVCTESDESCWSRNRRDEFEITSAVGVAGRE